MEETKGQILVVEDEEIVRDSLRDWLSDAGYQVETAEEVEEGSGADPPSLHVQPGRERALFFDEPDRFPGEGDNPIT